MLIGETTHGTHEFYRTRAELTKALILRKNLNLVAVEADWPDAYRVNRWVRHATDESDADAKGPVREALRDDRLERAIGVIYRPESERMSHYFRARLTEQFDAVLHIDQTTALEPLERWAHDEVDVPETYPTGI